MKAKTLCAIFLTAVMMLGLTACGKSSDTSTKTDLNAPAQTDAATEQIETDITEDTETQTTQIFVLGDNETITVNGQELSLRVDYPDGDDSWEGSSILSYGGAEVVVEEYCTGLADSYVLVDSADSFRVIVTTCHEDDWRISHLYLCDSSLNMTLCDSVDGSIDSVDDLTAASAAVYAKCDCFGSYSMIENYDISANTFQLSDPYCVIVNEAECDDGSFYDDGGGDYTRMVFDENGRRILRVKADFKAFDETENAVDIPVSSVIYPAGVNQQDGIFYFEMDGQTYHVNYSNHQDGMGLYIGDTSEYDIFECSPYAG